MSFRSTFVILILGVALCGCDSATEQKMPAQNQQVAPTGTATQADAPPSQTPPATTESAPKKTPAEIVAEHQKSLVDIQLESRDRDPMELVKQISETSVEDLAKLSYIELNLLKNATYAAKGYRFANDKIWLQSFFCDGIFSEDDANENLDEKDDDDYYVGMIPKAEIIRKKHALQEWRGKLQKSDLFDLSQYDFPGCNQNGQITEQQKLAAANVRIAIIKKLERSKGNLETTIDQLQIPEEDNVFFLLGRLFPSSEDRPSWEGGDYEYERYLDNWKMSLKRELMGLNQLIKLMNRLDSFDQMELLGLYAGDIALLKNIIEAKHGKPFQGVPGWEISQLIGVSDVKPDYDPAKLPVEVQVRIQILEETIKKILRSDLSDVPKELQEGTIHISDWYPAAC